MLISQFQTLDRTAVPNLFLLMFILIENKKLAHPLKEVENHTIV